MTNRNMSRMIRVDMGKPADHMNRLHDAYISAPPGSLICYHAGKHGTAALSGSFRGNHALNAAYMVASRHPRAALVSFTTEPPKRADGSDNDRREWYYCVEKPTPLGAQAG